MNRNDKGSGKYPLPLSFLFLYQMLQVLIVGDTPQLILDYLLDIFLDLVVVVLYGLLHAVVAIRIQEIVDDGDRLIMAFFSLYLVGIHDNLGMEDFLIYAFGEIVGNRADKHSLRQTTNLAWRNKAVHLGVDGSGDILTVDGNGLALLQHLSETLR